MTVNDLSKALHDDVYILVRINGDEIIYSTSIADILNDLVIDKIEITSTEEVTAIIKTQPVKYNGGNT